MKYTDDNSLIWFAAAIGLTGLGYLVRAFFAYRQVAADAQSDYDYKKSEGMLDKRMTEEAYIRAYKRFYAPRNHLFAGIALTLILILTPFMIMLFGVVSITLWYWAGQPLDYAPTGLVWHFLMYFSVIAMWGLVAFQVARLYHKRAPRTLRDEMMREVEGL